MTARWGAVCVSCLLALPARAAPAAAQATPVAELAIFRAWLDRVHPGYGRDEGPAPFRNTTVNAAYGGRRFYYVLTYARGMGPRFPKPLSLVAHVNDSGTVMPLKLSSVATFQPGLRKVATPAGARRAAAAVLILATGDPGERRWKFQDTLIAVRRTRHGWACTYRHGSASHTSQVTFDRRGLLSAISVNAPPVP